MLRMKGKDSTGPNITSGTGLQIVKDDKFYRRLISRETSAANNSCRVYYGVAAGAVPFVWESQPGTPKNPISSTSIPPLTPPPSYLFKPKKSVPTSKRLRHSKYSNLFMAMMPKLGFNYKKSQVLSSSTPSGTSTTTSSSSSSSSWSSSVPSSPAPSSSSRSLSYNNHGRSRTFSSPRSSFSSRGGEEDHQDHHQLDHDRSPTSTLCFGVVAGRQSSGGGLRGCYSMVVMKSALSSIIRSHGSAQGAA